MRIRKIAFAAVAAVAAVVTTLVVAPTSAADPADYVSLGDSFISVGSYTTTAMGTGCVQATDDVGHLVARQMPGTTFKDLACGGTSSDLVTKAAGQLSPATKYISISTGGNDNDFYADLITNCTITSATCTPAARRAAHAKLDELGGHLDEVYAAVRRAAPNAHVVVLGYLRLYPQKARGCFVETTLGQDAVDFGNEIQYRLNDEVAEAAHRAGFTMVNKWQDGTNSMCAPDGKRHVSVLGIGPGDEALAMHPTIAGRKYSAGLIAEAFAAKA
ncbi:SGNH/GDSL hydrolase family protein [Gordonia hydrophobica]|uniref:SGNH/GDSL hydrolase family protein n=1 Tax=Gordonia hydrophobica TaxID=40516 RepID=A0ABZ2U1D2_9ACTN|nr:SGNH/GDSL hydrolase family protein [Gordonia hydrophobica]MBM7368555.1 hypothetical protein [Gordonia hydrophobica]